MLRSLSLIVALLAALPAAAQPQFTFAVVGDTQNSGTLNHDVFPQIVEDIDALDPAFSLFCGDLIGGFWDIGTHQDAWEEWVTVASALDGEIYAVPGNHDFLPGASVYAAWQETFHWLPTANSPAGQEGMTYYFDYMDTRVVSVLTDSEWGYTTPDQSWLDAVLADPDSQAVDHLFVFSHHPVSFSEEGPLGTTAAAFWQSLVGNGVEAYFSGHWHRYQPSQLGAGGPTWETIIGTGGGTYYPPWRDYQQLHGFLLVEIDGDAVTASFYGDEDGDGRYDDVMDEYTITHAGAPPTGLVARYTFEDGSAGDSAPAPLGRGIHGTFLGDAAVVEDPDRGPVLQLDGSGDGVEAGAIGDHALSLNDDVTVSLFARPEQSGAGSWGQVLATYGTCDYYCEDEETNYSYWLSLVDGDHLMGFWEYEDGWNVTPASTEAVPGGAAGIWRHYAMARDSASRELRFYVDGALVGAPVTFDRRPTSGGRGMLYIGRDVVGSDGYEFAGRIDEVCIFNETLGEPEIAALAAGGDCAPEPGDDDDDSASDDDDSATDDDDTTDDDDNADDDSDPGDDDDSTGAEDDVLVGDGGCECGVTHRARAWPGVGGGLLLLFAAARGRRRS